MRHILTGTKAVHRTCKPVTHPCAARVKIPGLVCTLVAVYFEPFRCVLVPMMGWDNDGMG